MLQPQLLGPTTPTSIPRLVAATVIATTAVFSAGLLTGAALVRSAPPTVTAPAPTPVAEAVPVTATFVSSIPAIPTLGWTATATHGPLDDSLQWAATLYDASSQYSPTSWSAAQVLGAPDVYPRSGDDVGAWASLTADGGPEALEVGFDRPARLDAVHLLETYNPGAIRRVEGWDADGRAVVLYDRGSGLRRGDLEAGAIDRVLHGACTPFAISRLRVSLDSHLAAGWNELDAIGVHACR